MTPQVATLLKIHESDIAVASEGLLTAPRLVAAPPLVRETRPDLDQECLPALWRREAVHRRLLGLFDVAAASLVLFFVLGATRGSQGALAALVAMPMLLLPFKIAGLYDR